MTKKEQAKIEKLIDNLQCSYEEALDIIQKDKEIDRGKNPFPLSEKQEKESKEARLVKGDVKGDVKPRAKPNRIKKVNNEKLELMKQITGGFDDVIFINPEREATFVYNETKYKVVLSIPRK